MSNVVELSSRRPKKKRKAGYHWPSSSFPLTNGRCRIRIVATKDPKIKARTNLDGEISFTRNGERTVINGLSIDDFNKIVKGCMPILRDFSNCITPPRRRKS